nr:PREDICTED: cyclic nucleotide-binding domain-containing protein 2-like isoform X2 [Latimeria chalumnae]|eukprot:XP_014345626.1 PREDICTED: cyclic nucleotide-binding domain-containing protein 2-like isoform X2 [Latimeria chalumnae]
MCQVCMAFRRMSKAYLEFEFWGAIGQIGEKVPAEGEEKEKEKGFFDYYQFKRAKNRLHSSAVLITMKKPEWRTDEDLKLLRGTLQTLESFRYYSAALQLMLAKVLRFERFGRRRVVIKRGHAGSSFYFIYSGVVAVTKDEDGSSAFVGPEPILIQRGASFGEIALLKGLRRNATIVCMEETELLVVDKKDFFKYNLDVELKKEFVMRFNFFRSLELFESWPSHFIENISDRCKIQKFHFGQVVVADTSEMTSIVFVTKGKCDVLRLINLGDCPSYHKWIRRQPWIRKHFLNSDNTHFFDRNRPSSTMYQSFLTLSGSSSYRLQSCPPMISNHLSNKEEGKRKLSFAKSVSCADEKTEMLNKALLGSSLHSVRASANKKTEKLMVSTPYGEIPKALALAVYMRIHVVQEGEFFGLNQYLIPDQQKDKRSMALVSNNAFLIRLQKDKFEEFVDQTTLAKLVKFQTVYPSDDELCQIFLEQNQWNIFKKDVVRFHLENHFQFFPQDLRHKPRKSIPDSWKIDKLGTLDLGAIGDEMKSSTIPEAHIVPVIKGKDLSSSLPKIDVRLIHAIETPRPSVKEVFY